MAHSVEKLKKCLRETVGFRKTMAAG